MGATRLTEAELHGLVDGHLEPERRGDVLRRAAESPIDRIRLEAWQDQNELIRGAFGIIEREPIPPALDLRAPPRLVCVPAEETPIPVKPAQRRQPGRARLGMGVATIVTIAIGLGASWVLIDSDSRDAPATMPGLRGSADAALAIRTSDALNALSTVKIAPVIPPTTAIPDLSAAGFTFTGAEAQSAPPASITFHYGNPKAEHVVVGIARGAPDAASTDPVPSGVGFAWRRAGLSYVIAGTIQPGRLRAIAVALQSGDAQ